MKRTLLALALATCLSAHAATFNYHGNLQDAGKPADGSYDIELTLYSAVDGGKVVAGPLTMFKVDVHDGSFSTEAGFPTLANVPQQAWLGVRVRGVGESEFASMGARAPVGADAVASSVCPGAWTLDGNAGNSSGSYLGTADSQPLIFKVNGTEAGRITPGKGVAFAQGGFGATANGQNSFATGNGVVASGVDSFAGGGFATAGQDGSFMWGDNNTNGGIASTTAVNQYVVRAGGGVGINSAPVTSATEVTIRGSLLAADTNADLAMFPRGSSWGYDIGVAGTGQADGSWNISQTNGSTYTNRLSITPTTVAVTGVESINGAPKNSQTELSIYPTSGYNYPNIFMGANWQVGGILMSAGDATSATSNDAGFYIDRSDGTHQNRRLAVRNNGVVINDPANIPANSNTAAIAALNVVAPTGSTDAQIDMYPLDSANPALANYWSFIADKYEFDVIRKAQSTVTDPVVQLTYMKFRSAFGLPIVDVNAFLNTNGIDATNGGSINADSDITIGGNAYKPGGGPWLATSDRRIKQNIAPISDAIDTVLKLHPVSFHYTPEYRAMENNLPDKPYLGFIAQEFAQVFPEAVISTDKRVPGAAESDPKILALDSNPALITTVAAVQELAIENADLRTQLQRDHRALDELSARLAKLEHGMKGE